MDEVLAIDAEISDALESGRPVVALESTIISHGLPYPRNLETALIAENLVRERGVVPATVGILDGAIRVGLKPTELELLATGENVLKVSRKDLSFAVAQGLNGATTVSATMAVACLAGVEAFATGGIGGVHRGAENTWDVSADLTELARTPIIVVSAGAKAILDLAKTLEYLETQGVPVIGFGTREFPAFYSRSSGLSLDLSVQSAAEIARLFRAHKRLGMEQGVLVANPVAEEHQIPQDEIRALTAQAIEELNRKGIKGKAVTPFLLSRIVELTGGRALETNVHLLKSNVELACDIAQSLTGQPG
jgi:pseudouridine-5'-phosphate glycosidase